MRQVLASHEEPGLVRVAGVSPVIAAARVEISDPTIIDSVAEVLRSDPAVESVERSHFWYADEIRPRMASVVPVTPDDPDYARQAWHYHMIDLPEAWTIATGSAEVTVAVVDDGIRFDHPAIAANLTDDGYDFVDDIIILTCTGLATNAYDGDGYDPDPTNPMDMNQNISRLPCYPKRDGNHGLHVAGTIGAVGNDGVGGTGINWNIKIRPVRALGLAGGHPYDVAQAVLYAAGLPADDGNGGTVQAAYGAPIINMSLGGTNEPSFMHDAIIAATNAGSLVMAAAGNVPTTDPHYPASGEETVGISALGPDGILASYSTRGAMVDIAAPGGDPIDGDHSFRVYSTAWDYVDGVPVWAVKYGTSMAAPHVSGVAALLKGYDPSLTRDQLRARLLEYAVDAGREGFDEEYGHGVLNAWNSLTQTHHLPVGDLYARLYDASTGSVVRQVSIGPGRGFQFEQTAIGNYWVFAGEDVDDDTMLGIPGRRWGAYGGVTSPTPFEVTGPSIHDASFAFGYPAGSALGNVDNPHRVLVGTSFFDAVATEKWTKFEVSEAGSHTLETFP
jgi:serine protease